MTPAQKIAEKIAEIAEHVLFSDIPDDSFTSQGVEGRGLLRNEIAAALEAYRAEGVKEYKALPLLDQLADNIGYRNRIRAEALEEAAKVAWSFDTCVCHGSPVNCTLANAVYAIRALRDKP